MSGEHTADETDVPGIGELEAALREVRREIKKAALVHSSVDAALTGAAVGFAGTILGLDTRVSIELATVSVTTAAALASAGLVFLLGMAYRIRGDPEKRFEAVNADLTPALRTARDIVEDERTDVMARRLYSDVIDRLQSASSAELVRERRVAIAIVLVTLLSLGTIQAAVTGIELVPSDSADTVGGSAAGPERAPPTNTTLRSGDEVLGTPSDPSVGDEELRANISSSGSGGEEEPPDRSYEASGLPSETTVETSRAGFSSRDDVENADIIRDYNLQIRDTDDD